MKKSIYNTYIHFDNGDTLLYNAYEDTFAVIPSSSLQGCDVEALQPDEIMNRFPTLYNDMKKAGMLVNDDKDEAACLRKRIELIDNDPTLFQLHVNPTVDCNFRCWYCYEDHKAGTYMTEDIMERIFKFTDKVLQRKELRHFQLGFFGGEPLLRFDRIAKPIIKSIAEKCNKQDVILSLHFTSNGYLINDNIVNFLSRFLCGFQITFDGHRPHHDKTRTPTNESGSYDKILYNIQKLLIAGINVNARINYTGSNLPDAHKIIDDISGITNQRKGHLHVDLQKVWQDTTNWKDVSPYLNAIISKANSYGVPCHSSDLLNHVRDSCYGNKKNHILINYNGDAYCCTARDFNNTNRVGYLDTCGDIIWDKPNYMELRMKTRMNRPSCLKCRIAPICSGGCRQNGMERLKDGDYCMYGNNEDRKDYFVMVRFERTIMDVINNKEGQ